MPFQKHKQALTGARQALQGISKCLLTDNLKAFTATAVLNHHLTFRVILSAPHPLWVNIWIGNGKVDVVFVLLIKVNHLIDPLAIAIEVLLTHKGSDSNRIRRVRSSSTLAGDRVWRPLAVQSYWWW